MLSAAFLSWRKRLQGGSTEVDAGLGTETPVLAFLQA